MIILGGLVQHVLVSLISASFLGVWTSLFTVYGQIVMIIHLYARGLLRNRSCKQPQFCDNNDPFDYSQVDIQALLDGAVNRSAGVIIIQSVASVLDGLLRPHWHQLLGTRYIFLFHSCSILHNMFCVIPLLVFTLRKRWPRQQRQHLCTLFASLCCLMMMMVPGC